MSESKYGKHLIKAEIKPKDWELPVWRFSGTEEGVDAGWVMLPVSKPVLMEEKPHKHDFHQFLCFMGSDPINIGDLGAEIEIYLGDEQEKHIITTPTILHITPGLIHCPLRYKRVDRPVFHIDVNFTPDYKRKSQSDEEVIFSPDIKKVYKSA